VALRPVKGQDRLERPATNGKLQSPLMSAARLPPEQYYASLPKSINGAGAILHDEHGRFLIVRPSYRDDTWEIPGGGLEDSEFPWQGARREIKEELGLDPNPRAGCWWWTGWHRNPTDGQPWRTTSSTAAASRRSTPSRTSACRPTN
jgi:8-oxo-dGTP pyrophosphatase MutT (NUDIX family)